MADEKVIRRDFQAEFTPVGDGRTLDLRIIPYNTVARVRDNGGPEYDEEWLPGVFDKQVKAANRVFVNVEHEQGFGGVVGRGQEFREDNDAFIGSVRVLSGPDGDKALELVNDGVLTGVSVEAIPLRSQRTPEGVVQRVKARLLNIALCRNPAFVDAQVLAVREAPQFTFNVPLATAGTTATNPLWIPSTAEVASPEPPPEPEPPAPDPGPEPEPSRTAEVLSRVGYEQLVGGAVVDCLFDASPDRYTDEEFARSCLIVREGEDSVKTRSFLPILEPNGDLNVLAMRSASGRLGQAGLTPKEKGQAARKLIRYYRRAGEAPPPALVSTATR